jgi:hypothetical protein
MVSREEGYKRSAGKEALSLPIIESFFDRVLDIPLSRITDRDENYALGDFCTPNDRTIEAKGQEIDPSRYGGMNFVELFEVTRNPRHEGGFEVVADLLSMSPQQLAEVDVYDVPRRQHTTVGRPRCVSVSLGSISASAATVYVNYLMGGRHIYVYERDELMRHIWRAAPRGLLRGAGKSNEDTYAVKVPIADRRWSRTDGAWRWAGLGSADQAVGSLQALL